MIEEMRRLERKRGRSGKDRIDHPQYGGSDDIVNSVAGAVSLVLSKPTKSGNAVPIGVGRAIFHGVADAIKQPLGSRLTPDEERPGLGCAHFTASIGETTVRERITFPKRGEEGNSRAPTDKMEGLWII